MKVLVEMDYDTLGLLRDYLLAHEEDIDNGINDYDLLHSVFVEINGENPGSISSKQFCERVAAEIDAIEEEIMGHDCGKECGHNSDCAIHNGPALHVGECDCPMESGLVISEFEEKLKHLLNCESMENGSNTPDFLLAEYLTGCLELFNRSINMRDEYYKVDGITGRESK